MCSAHVVPCVKAKRKGQVSVSEAGEEEVNSGGRLCLLRDRSDFVVGEGETIGSI